MKPMKQLKLVTTREDVEKGIAQFNYDLAHADPSTRKALVDRLAFNRAWYYAPKPELVGPSKFVGYAGMTASLYVHGLQLDGRDTEPALQRLFRVLDRGSPEEALVRSKVEALLSLHGKALNRAARFCGPVGWKAPGRETGAGRRTVEPGAGRRTIHATLTREESYFVAECDQLAVVTQGDSLDETVENLREAIALHLEDEDLASLGLAPDPVVLVTIEILPWAA